MWDPPIKPVSDTWKCTSAAVPDSADCYRRRHSVDRIRFHFLPAAAQGWHA
jgi:hypothetical protein